MRRLFSALARTKDGAFVIDAQSRVIFWNNAAEAILGYSGAEALGRHCYGILGGRDERGQTLCQRYCQVAIQAQTGEVIPGLDIYARTATGENRWLNVTTFVYPTVDEEAGPVIVHLFRDATEQKHNQRFIERLLTEYERLKREDRRRPVTPMPENPMTSMFTAREREVLGRLAHGLGTEEIASDLVISPATVRNHIQNILGKLGVHSRLEAIAYAYQYGLADIDDA